MPLGVVGLRAYRANPARIALVEIARRDRVAMAEPDVGKLEEHAGADPFEDLSTDAEDTPRGRRSPAGGGDAHVSAEDGDEDDAASGTLTDSLVPVMAGY